MTGSEAGHGAMVSFSFMFMRLLLAGDIVPVQFIIDEMNRKNHPYQNDRAFHNSYWILSNRTIRAQAQTKTARANTEPIRE